MAATYTFNDIANPKVETKRFKLYMNFGTHEAPEWELQGRGVDNYTFDSGTSIDKTTDVLGIVDMERSDPQPTQSGLEIAIRKGSKLAEKLSEADITGDYSFLNDVELLKKYEYIDGATATNCKARLEKGCMIDVKQFTAEAGSYLKYSVDIHYANDFEVGEMAKTDPETIKFTPDTGV